MKRFLIALLVAAVATVGVFTFGAVSGAAHSGHAHAAKVSKKKPRAHVSMLCWQAFNVSGHTSNVRWWHCHGTSPTLRVHICGYSGTLHGITVYNVFAQTYYTYNHAHDVGGEGC